jgi:hypothetical protein
MTVVASILLAAIVGGVVFMLLDNWQRRSTPAAAQPPRRAEPAPGALFHVSTPPPRAERTIPLPGEEPTEPLRARHLWDDPPDDDEENRPPGLWSGWAR